MDAPTVTAVIPTRNRLALLRRCLAGVRAQVGVSVAIVVVDEASSDGTADYLAGPAGADLEVIRHDAPQGASAARNAGLARATTPWVSFCDDDDLWAPTKLRDQLDAAAAMPGAEWVCSGAVHVDDRLVPFAAHRVTGGDDIGVGLLSENVVPGGGSDVLVRTEALREIGGFDPTLVAWEDWDLWIRLARRGEPAIVDRPHVAYRVNTGSLTFNLDEHPHRGLLEAGRDAAAIDTGRYRRELARTHARAGRRGTAAKAYLSLAVADRSPADVVRAAAATLGPGPFLALGKVMGRRSIPREWQGQLGWLDDYVGT
jgi:glycosyltransferase involved in cell wall biosynthesis